jgi:hypothetical protein
MWDGIQVEKVAVASQSKSSNVWISKHCLHWLHLEPTHHVVVHTVYTAYTWSPLTWSFAPTSSLIDLADRIQRIYVDRIQRIDVDMVQRIYVDMVQRIYRG